jgi:anti-sigma factor RsiW
MKSSIDGNHLSQDFILRMLDDELPAAERLECESHLASCESCRKALASFHDFSLRIEAAIQSTPMPVMDQARRNLQDVLIEGSRQAASGMGMNNPGKVMRRFGWGMGIAATLAFAILMAPRGELAPQPERSSPAPALGSAQTATIEVDGETFAPVPFSNSDLSTAAPHIVQMQVPLSSLADIGIVVEPVTNRAAAAGDEGERSVLADVLVGADGQPRGVHVLNFE